MKFRKAEIIMLGVLLFTCRVFQQNISKILLVAAVELHLASMTSKKDP